jgi:hypothetical protein
MPMPQHVNFQSKIAQIEISKEQLQIGLLFWFNVSQCDIIFKDDSYQVEKDSEDSQ